MSRNGEQQRENYAGNTEEDRTERSTAASPCNEEHRHHHLECAECLLREQNRRRLRSMLQIVERKRWQIVLTTEVTTETKGVI